MDFHSKHFEVSGQDLSKRGILEAKIKKTIVKFKIDRLEYPFVPSFILNTALSSFGTKFARTKDFRHAFWENKNKRSSTLFWVIAKRFSNF